MASIQLASVRAALKKAHEEIDKAFAPILNAAAEADAEDENEEVKLTPIQKLEKQLETANEKLTKLNEKIAGGKSKIPDKDEENKAKFEEAISKINAKISEAKEKEAKKAAPKPAKVKAEKKVAEKAPEVAVEAKKHVPRITAAMTVQLQAAFKQVGAEWDDKYKKEFVTQVNSLSDEQFAEFVLEGHMSKFANTHAPAAGGGGGGGPGPLKTLDVSQLQKQNKNLKQVSVGVFQHKTTGEMVTGPAEDSDEEFEDKTVDGVEYIVGQTTKRVYKPQEDGPDEFVGYWGVGEW